ncbi:MAG TPA: DUF542 domain-containing protein [Kouleothrix sp.]|nr:DUF542 domain-containing protein [Kouleothrix sp.]
MTTVSSSALDATMTLNQIVASWPAALPVLQRFGLDTCCGGALPLSEAAAHHQIAPQALLAALAEVGAGNTPNYRNET